jgi:segregation and condensation protein B
MSDLTEIKRARSRIAGGRRTGAGRATRAAVRATARADTVRNLLDELRVDWEGRKVELVQVASGWRFQGRIEMQSFLDRLTPETAALFTRGHGNIGDHRLPATRHPRRYRSHPRCAVSTNVVKTLEDRQWVEVVGHRETPGRPALYATTKTFLDDLGLRSSRSCLLGRARSVPPPGES